jgi:glutamate synthase (ferredoxin)
MGTWTCRSTTNFNLNDLRSRVVLECDGQLKQVDVAVAALLGAEEFGFALHLSSVRLYYDESLSFKHMSSWYCYKIRIEKNFKGTQHINFMYFIAEELREIMAQLGFRT